MNRFKVFFKRNFPLCVRIARESVLPWVIPQYRALKEFQKAGGEKLRVDYDLIPTDIVFDLGGYMGDWTAQIIQKAACEVFVFEPIDKYSAYCAERFSAMRNIHICPFGLDVRNHDEEMSEMEDGSSIYKRGVMKQKVRFVSIEDFMEQEKIDEVALMKINIEGGEYNILESLIATGSIRKFRNVQIQFHDISAIQGKERMLRIWKELEKTHRLKWAFRPWVHESWQRRDECTE